MVDAVDVITYSGYRLNVHRHANGWKVGLYKADGIVAEPNVPGGTVFAARDACIAEAKLIIDKFFQSMSLSEVWH